MWRANPGNETGMPRKCIRDGKGAQKTHMVGAYLSSDRVGIYDWQELAAARRRNRAESIKLL